MSDFAKNNWSFSNNYDWTRKFPSCGGDFQSPINIDTSKLMDIGNLRELTVGFKSSKCFVMTKNNTPTLKYDPGSNIKLGSKIYELSKITLHSPSMHTINGEYYDMEVAIYCCMNTKECNKGVILSVLFLAGDDSSLQNDFFSQFINRIPKGESKYEKEIKVSNDWNIASIFPESKSFFYYEGSLPYPPCTEGWEWIVFEEPAIIGKTNYDIFNLVIKYTDRLGNVRTPVKPLNNRKIFYQSQSFFTENNAVYVKKLENQIEELEKKKTDIEKENEKNNHLTKNDDNNSISNVEKEMNMTKSENLKYKGFIIENKIYIKGIFMAIILLIIIFMSIKLTKYIVRSGMLYNFMTSEVNRSKKKLEEKNKLLKSDQQPNMMGGPPPDMMGGPPSDMMGGPPPGMLPPL